MEKEIFNSYFGLGFTAKVTFKQSLEGGEKMSSKDILERVIQVEESAIAEAKGGNMARRTKWSMAGAEGVSGEWKMRAEVYGEPKHIGSHRSFRKHFTFTLNGVRSPWRILSRRITRSDLHLTININLFVILKNKKKMRWKMWSY